MVDKAMEAFRRAVAASDRNLAPVRTDTELAALAQREDFQTLMLELEAAGKEGSPSAERRRGSQRKWCLLQPRRAGVAEPACRVRSYVSASIPASRSVSC